MSLFEVTDLDIQQLNAEQLPDLLRRLLNLEAEKFGISRSGINVAGSVTTPDGGVDGSVIWSGEPLTTAFLSRQNLVFQAKAGNMTPTSAGGEVENRRWPTPFIKPMVDRALSSGAGYILWTTTNFTDVQRLAAIDSIREKFREHSKPYAESAFIDVYDLQKIKTWVNDFLPAISVVHYWVGRALPHAVWPFELWQRIGGVGSTPFCADETLSRILEDISSKIQGDSIRIRMVGPSGIGKTRLIFEACKVSQQEARVVYIDAGMLGPASYEIFGLLPQFHQRGAGTLLIVDNCELAIHRALEAGLPPNVSLVTIDFNNDESLGHGELIVPRASNSVVSEIARSGWPDIDAENLAKIIEYADGFPLIAAALAEDFSKAVDDLGRLRNDEIKRRLLGSGASSADLSAIEALSLFGVVGFENTVSPQYQFIAENIAGLSPQDFYR